MPASPLAKFEDIPCCPELDAQPICDVLDFRRRLVFPTPVRGPQEQPVKVEVVFHTRFTRCSGPLALGDIAYSTTLLPGETVRLATTDRRSRFSFDSESKLSYRSEQISEEQYRLRALRSFMSDENVVDRGNDNFTEQGKWDFHGDASGSIGFFSAGADANARGSHSGSSAHDYLREHRAHAETSDNQSVEATRRAHSVSIGEVSSRTHTQGESEDHFEASSREFTNHNQCHAVTFLFYRINKTETIKFELVSIERRVLDPVTPMPVPANPFRPLGQVATVPQEVPATNLQRVAAMTAASKAIERSRRRRLRRCRAPATSPVSSCSRVRRGRRWARRSDASGGRAPRQSRGVCRRTAGEAGVAGQGRRRRKSSGQDRSRVRATDLHPHRRRHRQGMPG